MQPCFIKKIDSDSHCLSCQILPSNLGQQQEAGSSECEKKPEWCDDPLLQKIEPILAKWQKHHTKHCAHRYHYLGRCGSEPLDPTKHPAVWKKYVRSIEKVFKEKLVDQTALEVADDPRALRNQTHSIHCICFASGLLVLDFLIIKHLFLLDAFKQWKAAVHFDWIDFKYQGDKDSKLSKLKAATEWGALLLQRAFLGKIMKKEESDSVVGSAMSDILSDACPSKTATQTSMSTLRDTEKQVAQEVILTLIQDLAQVLYDQNQNVKVTFSFFPNKKACIKTGKDGIDLILAYDSGLESFDRFIKEKKKEDGHSIFMIKHDHPYGKDRPTLLKIEGPEGFIKSSYLGEKEWHSYR